MNTVAAAHPFIELDHRGVPWVIGTNIKVHEIVLDGEIYDWNARKIVEEFPHLTLVNVHAAFCYYFDHKGEVDREIEEFDREFERIKASMPEPPVVQRLRDAGLIGDLTSLPGELRWNARRRELVAPALSGRKLTNHG
jgi:uncharacterized protein (DUF433 family)